MSTLTSGKLVNLQRLTDAAGRFKMLAIDQRDSLRNALGKATGRAPAEVTYADLAEAKAVVTDVLSPLATATLVDPVYGLPRAVKLIPGDVGLLAASEETGYERAGADGRQRKSRLIDGWSVAKAKRAGANAVKLLIYYNPDASPDVLGHQQGVVRAAGGDCAREDIPFLLELVTYPLSEPSADTPEFARKRTRHAIESAREFSTDEYGVDILKLEFPGDLKYSREYAQGAFDGKVREPVWTLSDAKAACRELDGAARRPWVILSGGVDINEFLVNLTLAVDAGASGFLCGRAIWKDVVPKYPDLAAMREFLERDGAANFARANAAAELARPWHAHPHFGGWDRVELAQMGEEWYRRYQAEAAPVR
jgi:tagatose 1,6-diphosphate aldolase